MSNENGETGVKTHNVLIQVIALLVGFAVLSGAVIGGTLAIENYLAGEINEWFNPPEEDTTEIKLDFSDITIECVPPTFEVYEASTFEDARKTCAARGLDLATITRPDDYVTLSDLIGASEFWIGLSDSEAEGTWQWSNGQYLSYTNWATGQPEEQVTSREFQFESSKLNWNKAQKSCQDKGMELASIHSQEELDRAVAMTDGQNTWLGLKNANGKTEWEDGSPIDFTNWSTGMPDEEAGGCVHLWKFSKMKWHEWLCIYKHQYLCSYTNTTADKDCAVVESGQWKAVECVESYPFACSDQAYNYCY